MTAKTDKNNDNTDKLHTEPDDFLDLRPPTIPDFLDNVLLVFANNIPEDAKKQCTIVKTGAPYPENGNETAKRRHLLEFVDERLTRMSHLEYSFWLNGRLPFITPRELILWRLRQYIEYIWAFQLPDNDDLAMILNTTKMRAAHIAADFIARFRKALLFPIVLRRLYRILREEDEYNVIVDREYEHKFAYGSTFQVPSQRYLQDANALIEEFRLREATFLRDAALVNKEENILWVSERVIELAKDNNIRRELFNLYKIPRESGYEG